ncbi:MAG: hypothetical protein AMXMBFR33_20360 [Candidatus Xenobia bacterium]
MCQRLTLIALSLVLLALPAPAQTLNMDFSWGIQSQQAAWDYGQWAAANAAQNWYDQVQAYRQATGYTGFIPGPVSQAQLQSSIREMNQAFDRYNQLYDETPSSRYAEQAIMNQSTWVNPGTGQEYWLPTDHDQYSVSPDGTVWSGPYAPGGSTLWTPLTPAW